MAYIQTIVVYTKTVFAGYGSGGDNGAAIDLLPPSGAPEYCALARAASARWRREPCPVLVAGSMSGRLHRRAGCNIEGFTDFPARHRASEMAYVSP